MEKILLSSYTIRILGKDKNYHILSSINGSIDFISLFKDFTDDIFRNVTKSLDSQGRHTIHLTLEEGAQFDKLNKRHLYGFFSSGVGGERYKVVDTLTNTQAMNVEPRHAAFRNVFFYLFVPTTGDTAYLILQRKQQFGIKLKLREVLNQYLFDKGYNDLILEFKNVLLNRVYAKMMSEGNLKKVELIKRRIPKSIEEYIHNDEKYVKIPGTFRTVFSSRTSLPNEWKEYLDRKFKLKSFKNDIIEIQDLDDNYSEIEFELELNGKKKTFFILNQQRIQPDIDVTSNIKFKDEEPTIESLIAQAKELINDLTQIPNLNAKQNKLL